MADRIQASDIQKYLPSQYVQLKQGIFHSQSLNMSFESSLADKKGCVWRTSILLVIQKSQDTGDSYLICLQELQLDNFPFKKTITNHSGKTSIRNIKKIDMDDNILKIYIKNSVDKQIIQWNCKFHDVELSRKWQIKINQEYQRKKKSNKSTRSFEFENQFERKQKQQMDELIRQNNRQQGYIENLCTEIGKMKQQFNLYREYFFQQAKKAQQQSHTKSKQNLKQKQYNQNLLIHSRLAKSFEDEVIVVRPRQDRAQQIFKYASNSSVCQNMQTKDSHKVCLPQFTTNDDSDDPVSNKK